MPVWHRGYMSARYWNCSADTLSQPYKGFRPILEVLGLDTLGDDGSGKPLPWTLAAVSWAMRAYRLSWKPAATTAPASDLA